MNESVIVWLSGVFSFVMCFFFNSFFSLSCKNICCFVHCAHTTLRLALLLNIEDLVFSSVILSNSCFILCSFSLREQLFGLLSKSFCMTFSSLKKETSLFLLFRALRLDYFMVKALIDIFIRSHLRPLSFK